MNPTLDSVRHLLQSGWRPVFEQHSHGELSAPASSLCAITDVGNLRSHNEDAYSYSLDCSLLVVADGMGGTKDRAVVRSSKLSPRPEIGSGIGCGSAGTIHR